MTRSRTKRHHHEPVEDELDENNNLPQTSNDPTPNLRSDCSFCEKLNPETRVIDTKMAEFLHDEDPDRYPDLNDINLHWSCYRILRLNYTYSKNVSFAKEPDTTDVTSLLSPSLMVMTSDGAIDSASTRS